MQDKIIVEILKEATRKTLKLKLGWALTS